MQIYDAHARIRASSTFAGDNRRAGSSEACDELETIFSLSGEVPPIEGAVADEPEDALQPGAVARGSVRQICSIRKLSGGGALLHLDMPVEPGERLALELMSGELLHGAVAWRRGAEVGLKFDEPLDVFGIIARDLVNQPGERRRLPRVELRCPATVETVSRTGLVTTRDVSQGGAKVETPVPLQAEDPVVLTLDGFRPVEGVVRWHADGVAGIEFVPEIGWQELMPWLKERRDAALNQPAGDAQAAAAVPQSSGGGAAAPGSVDLNLPARVREGMRRWSIEVASITTRTVEFDSFAALRLGTLLWIVLPGLEGWPARIVAVDGYRFTCEFTQPLHPAVLERILARAREGRD